MANPDDVSDEERFLFDLQGYILLRSVLSPTQTAELRAEVERLEARNDYDDGWMSSVPPSDRGLPSFRTRDPYQASTVRLNGLLRISERFDSLVDHPRVLPRLRMFQGDPQIINTWSIAKEGGAPEGTWHCGLRPNDYRFIDGNIRSPMLNVVWFLSDNGGGDGGLVVVPGSHKANLGLDWTRFPGMSCPGAREVRAAAGDVLMFSEALLHNGLAKTTPGRRVNLYFNYLHALTNIATLDPRNLHHYWMPPEARTRLTPERRALTAWMDALAPC